MSTPIQTSFRFKINPHGIFGIVAVGVMISIGFYRHWEIPWFYFVSSVLIYSVAVISMSMAIEKSIRESLRRSEKAAATGNEFQDRDENLRFELFRFLMGSHMAFLFLALGLALGSASSFVTLGIFFASISGGLLIPFLLIKRG